MTRGARRSLGAHYVYYTYGTTAGHECRELLLPLTQFQAGESISASQDSNDCFDLVVVVVVNFLKAIMGHAIPEFPLFFRICSGSHV